MNPVSLQIPALQAAYRSRTLRPCDVLAEVSARIEARGNDGVWIGRRWTADLEAIAARLEAVEDGPEHLPLYGVPFAVKDNIDVAGLQTTAGCPAFAYMPDESAPVVAALEAAGAIVIGKTNLDQFATGLTGTRSPYGIPRSVFHNEYIAGGSSAGSAVAVAAGLVSFALGTDTAGSGRVPAALNNITGLKPSRGRLSTRGVVPACRALDCVSVFGLSVSDSLSVVEVALGFDSADPYVRAPPARPLDIQTPRIAILTEKDREFFGDRASANLYETAIAHVRALGGRVIEIDYAPFREAAQLLYGPFVAQRAAAQGAFIMSHAEEVHPVVREIILGAFRISGVELAAAEDRLQALKCKTDLLWAQCDALLLPTVPTTFRVEEVLADPIALNARLGTYTNFVNLLDCAAVSVPAGFRPDGLPFGVTFIGPAQSDTSLAQLADRFHRSAGCGAGLGREPLADAGQVGPASGLVELAVVGAHLRGEPLHHELSTHHAVFLRETRTAKDYKLYELAGTVPAKPGLVHVPQSQGPGITVEIYALSVEAFGRFVAGVPAPLGIGSVSLEDGRTVKGFIAEPAALEGAREITAFGGWRAYRNRRS